MYVIMGNKQPNLWAAECITFTAATIFIFLRLFSRRLMRIPLWWDDYLAMACYVSQPSQRPLSEYRADDCVEHGTDLGCSPANL